MCRPKIYHEFEYDVCESSGAMRSHLHYCARTAAVTIPLGSLVQRDVEASTVASYPWRGRVWAPGYDALCTLLECAVW